MARTIDGHNDVLSRLHEDGAGDDALLSAGTATITVPSAQAGGLAAGLFAVLPRDAGPRQRRDARRHRSASSSRWRTSARSPRACSGSSPPRRAGSAWSVTRPTSTPAWPATALGAILHMEGAEAIDPGLDTLEVWYAAGLRSVGIVWSRPNAFGHGVPFSFPSSPDTGDGLTPAGIALVRRCAELGIAIDLSHLNAAGFWDVARTLDGPLIASHSCAHALCPSARNLTDDQLDAIAASGGLVGICFATGFLRADGERRRRHADRADRRARALRGRPLRRRPRGARIGLRRRDDARRGRRRLGPPTACSPPSRPWASRAARSTRSPAGNWRRVLAAAWGLVLCAREPLARRDDERRGRDETPITAIPADAPIAGWKPSSIDSASADSPLPLTIAATIASPTAPPTWNDVFSRPEARPCSWSSTPATAWMLSAGNASAKPTPSSSIVGSISAEVGRACRPAAGTARSRPAATRRPRAMIRARPEAVHQRPEPRRAERDEQAGRQERQRGLERRPAVHRLQVQRADELEAEVAAEQQHRRRGWPAPAAPSAGCRAGRAGGRCAARSSRTSPAARRRARTRDRDRRAPALVRGLDDGADEQQHRGRHGDRAGDVVAPALTGDEHVARDHARRDGEDGERERDRQQESPAPADLGQRARRARARARSRWRRWPCRSPARGCGSALRRTWW